MSFDLFESLKKSIMDEIGRRGMYSRFPDLVTAFLDGEWEAYEDYISNPSTWRGNAIWRFLHMARYGENWDSHYEDLPTEEASRLTIIDGLARFHYILFPPRKTRDISLKVIFQYGKPTEESERMISEEIRATAKLLGASAQIAGMLVDRWWLICQEIMDTPFMGDITSTEGEREEGIRNRLMEFFKVDLPSLLRTGEEDLDVSGITLSITTSRLNSATRMNDRELEW